jgi:GntR family transcriptional regulator, transcriptional repressor for pyruvate dehydrogenase complex
MRVQRQSLPGQVAHEFLAAIVGGAYAEGAKLPAEPELVTMTGVSRLTLREAMKLLQAKGVIRIEQGRGTFVNPSSSWSPLDPMVLAARAIDPASAATISRKLLEARRLVEVGVAELGAARRTEGHLVAMEQALASMRQAHRAADRDTFVAADIEFHQVIIHAAGNEIVAALYSPIQDLVLEGRRQTSSWPDARAAAIDAHERILEAVRQGDPDLARKCMLGHLTDTAARLEEHIGAPATEEAAGADASDAAQVAPAAPGAH